MDDDDDGGGGGGGGVWDLDPSIGGGGGGRSILDMSSGGSGGSGGRASSCDCAGEDLPGRSVLLISLMKPAIVPRTLWLLLLTPLTIGGGGGGRSENGVGEGEGSAGKSILRSKTSLVLSAPTYSKLLLCGFWGS